MKTLDEVHNSKALEEVWEWKEKSFDTTKDLSVEQLLLHYSENVKKLSQLLETNVVQLKNGAYIFEK